MSSVIEICNKALGNMGNSTNIASLDEASVEAQQCKLHYASTRDALLREVPWPWAQKRVFGALLAETPEEEWAYRFAYPTDSARLLFIFDTQQSSVTKPKPLPYELGIADDLESQVIKTNVRYPRLVYTAKVTNPLMFDALFEEALALKLAVKIAIPLTAKADLVQILIANFDYVLGKASAVAANEGGQTHAQEASWMQGES